MVKRDYIRAALVPEELPVHAGHLLGSDEVEAEFGSSDTQLLIEDVAEDAAEEGKVEAAVALAVAELERDA